MTNWTRAHDAWIARECEGLEVLTCAEAMERTGIESERIHKQYLEVYGNYWIRNTDGEYVPLGSYLTDPAAAIRAAEAWSQQKEDRGFHITRIMACVEPDLGLYVASAEYGPESYHAYRDTPAAALAQALYRATGGPA